MEYYEVLVGAMVGLYDGVRELNERRAALRAGTRRVRAYRSLVSHEITNSPKGVAVRSEPA